MPRFYVWPLMDVLLKVEGEMRVGKVIKPWRGGPDLVVEVRWSGHPVRYIIELSKLSIPTVLDRIVDAADWGHEASMGQTRRNMSRRPGRKLNDTQKKNKATVDELVELTIELGITNDALQPYVREALYKATGLQGLRPDGDLLLQGMRLEADQKLDEIFAAGRTAQLHFLLGQWGATRLRNKLNQLGSFLDGFVRRMDTDPDQLRADIGQDNVTRNGDVQ